VQHRLLPLMNVEEGLQRILKKTMPTTKREKPVREPVQQRSIQKKNRILRAARKLINEIGYNELTTHKIAHRADVSVGTVYSYFRNKRDIFLEITRLLLDDFFQHHKRSFAESMHNACSLEEAIELVARRYKEEFEKEKRLHKEISIQSYLDEEFQKLYLTNYTPVHLILDKVTEEYPDLIEIEDYEATSFLILHTAGAVIHYLVLFGSESSEEVIIKEITKMMYRYISKKSATGTDRVF
jgi:AcrR family transcriptional regulator